MIVVDSRPRLEGREALRRLVQRGISCTYVLISAVSYILPEVTEKQKSLNNKLNVFAPFYMCGYAIIMP